jgi:hypothetical protein
MKNDIIENLFENFISTLSLCIEKYSRKLHIKGKQHLSNPQYDLECKIARRDIRSATSHIKYKYPSIIVCEHKNFAMVSTIAIKISRRINYHEVKQFLEYKHLRKGFHFKVIDCY